MARVKVSIAIDAPPKQVWRDVRDLASHAQWMTDAVAIRYTTRQRRGVGTAFECDTQIGPVRLTDRMVVTEWDDGRIIGVRHVGVVTGRGRFIIRRRRRGGTTFTWDERLRFPVWMGGPVGALVGARVLKRVWRRNLRNLKHRIESRG